MKKLIIAIVAVFAMSTAASAQIQDLGVRVGAGYGYGAELSAMWNLGDHYNAISLAGIYHWTGAIAGEFNWFAGVGAWLGIWSYDDGYSGEDDGFNLAVAGQAGIEWNPSAIPFQFTLDVRPRFNLITRTHFDWGGVALGIRYRF